MDTIVFSQETIEWWALQDIFHVAHKQHSLFTYAAAHRTLSSPCATVEDITHGKESPPMIQRQKQQSLAENKF